ncbi:unnamed protein product, partial [Didymodactylos carnosus]
NHAPIVQLQQPPVITQETISTSPRTSVASGRLSILSEKLSRLSISSANSRPSVASDSILLHKKSETRMSQSYDDNDAKAVRKHYTRRESRVHNKPRLSTANCVNINEIEEGTKAIRFKLFPDSDTVEKSISNIMPPLESEQPQLKTNSATGASSITCTRQSLLRSPSARYAIPKFPISNPIKAQTSVTSPRVSIAEWTAPLIGKVVNYCDQGLLSPPSLTGGEKETLSLRSKSISTTTNESALLSLKQQFHVERALRGALGSISPDMYMQRGGKGGFLDDEAAIVKENSRKLHLRIQYDDHRNELIVNVIEAQGLPIDKEEFSNPYGKLYLRPPVDQKLRQTSVQHQTLNPCWDEYFKFNVATADQLKTKTLFLYIYNYEQNSRPEFIGETQVKLTPQKTNGSDLWCNITKQRSEDEYLGELLVSLTYLVQAERLNVGIVEARNLKALSMHNEADPIVRLTFTIGHDKVKRKKTSVKRNTLNPKWNEELSFNTSGIALTECCLELGVYHHDLIGPDEPLGFLRFETKPNGTLLNSTSQIHSEIIHWTEVIECQQRTAVWHVLHKAAGIQGITSSS